jgi:hypothetical protein
VALEIVLTYAYSVDQTLWVHGCLLLHKEMVSTQQFQS